MLRPVQERGFLFPTAPCFGVGQSGAALTGFAFLFLSRACGGRYDPSFDEEFTQSFTSLAWPRASATAGSLWNYQASLDPSSQQYADLIANHNARLTARGCITCPNGCACDWNSKYVSTPLVCLSLSLSLCLSLCLSFSLSLFLSLSHPRTLSLSLSLSLIFGPCGNRCVHDLVPPVSALRRVPFP